MTTAVADIPAYTVRRSTRARRIRLTVNARDGLVVVVPAGMRVDADRVVASKAAWAHKALAAVAEKHALFAAGPQALLPEAIDLRFTGRSLRVEYVDDSVARPAAREHDGALVVSGPADPESRLAALSRWLDRVARRELPVLLEERAERAGVAPATVRVTKARSRWGSCSARKTISLNRNLLFLERDLAAALIDHELAHLRHMDHSAAFWRHLHTLDPDAGANRARLRSAGDFVPAWADA